MVTMNEKDSAKVGEYILEEKSRKLPVQGRYILSTNQTFQEAYALTTGQHSIFTYYLLEGLRGNTESIDSESNVTPQSLGNYVYRKIMSLSSDERPKQKPILKTEESRNVILASYPELKPLLAPPSIMPTNKGWKQGWLKNLGNKFTRVGRKHATKGDRTLDDV
jgi:hypothetical protein